MYSKMIILLTCLAMVASVTEALVEPCNITDTSASGLETATNTTISNCQSGLASAQSTGSGSGSGSGSTLGTLLSTLLNSTVPNLLNQIVALLKPLLSNVLTLVVKLLTQVLTLVVNVVNLVIELLNGNTNTSQCKSGIKQWYSTGCSSVSQYQSSGLLTNVLTLVNQLLEELGVGLLGSDLLGSSSSGLLGYGGLLGTGLGTGNGLLGTGLLSGSGGLLGTGLLGGSSGSTLTVKATVGDLVDANVNL